MMDKMLKQEMRDEVLKMGDDLHFRSRLAKFQRLTDVIFVKSKKFYVIVDVKVRRLELVSLSLLKKLGLTHRQATEVSYLDFSHPEDVEKDAGASELLSDSYEDPFRSYPTRYICKDGSILHVEWHDGVNLNGDNRLWFSFASEITKERYEELVEELSKKFDL